MGLENLITEKFNPETFVPAVGQGALGVETLKGSEYDEYIKELDDPIERMRIDAERSFMRRLNGGCHVPIGTYSIVENDDIYIIGMFELDGKLIRKDIRGKLEDGIKVGEKLAEKILSA